ncbi:MAG: serine/threonine-protein kinase [Nannocystaceae bacterium]
MTALRHVAAELPIDATLKAHGAAAVPTLSRTHADTERQDEDDDHRPSAAARIGRFQILHELGAGGMGIVYAAYDSTLDRRVALKLLLRGDALHVRARDRLRREAQAMARISHPNVVHIYDVGEHDDQIYVAMEYIDGVKLSDWLREAAPGWSAILDVFIETARGLQAAHEAEVVHRDFKPDNVVLRRREEGDKRRPRPKVLDFGLAAVALEDADAFAEPDGVDVGVSARLTQTGSLMGTPRYMSPEQFAGVPSEPRSDQFSFAVALYEALYDQHPFAGESFSELRASVLNGELREPPDGEIPPWIFEVLARALQRVPGHRWESMDALIAAILEHPERADPDLDRTVAMRQRVRLVSALTVIGVGLLAALIYLRLFSAAGVAAFAFWSKILFASGLLLALAALRKIFDRNAYNRRFAAMIGTIAVTAIFLALTARVDGLTTAQADRYILAATSLCFLQASASVERIYLWIALLGALGVAASFVTPFAAPLALGLVILISMATATLTWRRRSRRAASGTLSGRVTTTPSLRRSRSSSP